MNDNEVLQEYRKKVVIFLLGVIMFSVTAAGIVFPVMKAFGLYPAVSVPILLVFEIIIVLEDIIGGAVITRTITYKFLPPQYKRAFKS